MKSIIIKLEKLFLDPNNYRLRSNPNWRQVSEKDIIKPIIQKRTSNFIVGENNFKINDLIESIKSNGFLKVDNILVRKYLNTNNYIVIEGNRRVAALKALYEQKNKGYEIGKLQDNVLDKGVDVVLYKYADEKDYLILMGLKHVSGNKKWDFYNQAKLVNELKNSGESETDIAKKIGISKSSVEQQIKGYHAIQNFLDEINSENYGENFDPYQKLQMFIELTTKPKLKKWVGWDETALVFKNIENKKRFFSWITPQTEFEEDDNEQQPKEPIIVSHKQVRDLENIIEDDEALQFMEQSRNFDEALNQNFAYTQAQFSKIIKNVEKMLRNIPIGNILSFTTNDRKSMQNIKKVIENFLSKSNLK